MRWHIHLDLTGALTTDQAEQIMATPSTIVHTNDTAKVVTIDAAHETATTEPPGFAEVLGGMPLVQALYADGTLHLRRLVIATGEAAEQDLAILSTKGVAARLGISNARVRQLKDTDPTFPRPFEVPGAAGDFYRTTDVDAYRRQPGTSEAGRPRATDEPRLVAALRAVLDQSTISDAARAQIEQALQVSGGRYVRGKALLLARTPTARLREVEAALDYDELAEFLDAVKRARELLGE